MTSAPHPDRIGIAPRPSRIRTSRSLAAPTAFGFIIGIRITPSRLLGDSAPLGSAKPNQTGGGSPW